LSSASDSQQSLAFRGQCKTPPSDLAGGGRDRTRKGIFQNATPIAATIALEMIGPIPGTKATCNARARVMGFYISNRNVCAQTAQTWNLFNDDRCTLPENWTRML
jgi:hypothetical protein